MNTIFFIKSEAVEITKFNIKDIPGSSGRLDVITRCILAALLRGDSFERNTQIWVFLDHYGTYIFNSEQFNYEIFPKNELLFTDHFVNYLKKDIVNDDKHYSLLRAIRNSKMNIIEAIKHFLKLNYNIYILHEEGQNFFELLTKIQEKQNIIFILGAQEDKFLNSEELLAFKIPTISFGTQSYLASSVIRLLKLYLFAL